jgi:formate dehydrogenase iron-sulfur subunit
VRIGAAVTGVLGVFCSVMVYVATKREQWSPTQTGIKFFGTVLTLGGAAVFAVSSFTERGGPDLAAMRSVLFVVATAAAIKLSLEARILVHARDRRQSTLKRMATVMLGELQSVTNTRFISGVLGGIVLPLLLGSGLVEPADLRPVAAAMFVLILAGEFAERYLFFRAAPASRMPGALR